MTGVLLSPEGFPLSLYLTVFPCWPLAQGSDVDYNKSPWPQPQQLIQGSSMLVKCGQFPP